MGTPLDCTPEDWDNNNVTFSQLMAQKLSQLCFRNLDISSVFYEGNYHKPAINEVNLINKMIRYLRHIIILVTSNDMNKHSETNLT